MFSYWREALLALCMLSWPFAAFGAGDCNNGRVQYSRQVVGGLSCSNSLCHGPDPSIAPNNLSNGTNNAARIADAIERGTGGMDIFKGLFTAAELDDLGAWIAWGPSCQTPVVSVSPATLVFGPQAVGTTSNGLTYIVITNTGPVPTSVSVTQGNAAEFPINSTCQGLLSVGGVCAIRVSFQPSAQGARSGTVMIDAGGGGKLVGVYGSGTSAGSNTLDAVEYYYAEFDSYFVTAQPDEVVKLDNGIFVGWTRTGYQFKVNPIGTSGSLNVCRFYSVAFGPKSAHFYTPIPDECARLKANPDWIFEAEVFAIPGSAADGTCSANRVPIYRVYNNGEGGAPNHRYTTSVSVRDAMIAAGWVLEGNGPGFAFMCAPP